MVLELRVIDFEVLAVEVLDVHIATIVSAPFTSIVATVF